MERETWTALMRQLSGLDDRRPPRCQFTNHEIVSVFLWASLHDRPVCWACDPRSWPGRRRELPSSSTMTRRLRTLSVRVLLRRLMPRGEGDMLVCLDAKPLQVSRFSKDKQAKKGYAAGGYDRGYKLHAACDRRGVPIACTVRPMNEAESTVARPLPSRAARPGTIVVADAGYDSNALHAIAAGRGASLLAPRRKPGRGLGHHRQHPGRLRSIRVLEGDRRKKKQASPLRSSIERFFGWLTGVGGGALPPWERTLPRVRNWIIAKIVILAARDGL